MHRLVAVDLPGGPAFVDAVRRVWEDGDALLVVDRRLPDPARRAVLDAARPHVLLDGEAEHVVDAAAPPTGPDDALVVASSGTTGRPKLVVHTHDSVSAHARAVHERLAVDAGRDRWLACLPLAHLGGLGVVLRSILTGTPVDVTDGFDAADVASSPVERGSTLVSLVATALDRLDAGAYRWVVLGGSADPAPRPANVVHTYGLTETGGGVVYDGVPLPGIEVDVAEDGAIRIRGPVVARGRRGPDGAVVPVTDDEGWLATGDLGGWEPDGRLRVDGRADDLIVTGGENVWPDLVEAALATHPAVAEVAVVGRPDPTWGQRVVAVVVPRDPSAPPTLDELRGHLRERLPAFAAPREVMVARSLPRTNLGKVRRSALPG